MLRMPWILTAAIALSTTAVYAQTADSVSDSVHVANGYQVQPNIIYRTIGGWDGKLDIYQPRGLKGPNPTIIYFHGGGFTTGTKEAAEFSLLPWLQMGWTVVNVEYRLNSMALAPAAVEDSRCALRWVYRNAKTRNFDTSKLVLSGSSVGGHLALIAGMLPSTAATAADVADHHEPRPDLLDATCPGVRPGGSAGSGPPSIEELKVAAIVDWSGIKDAKELITGPRVLASYESWFGAQANREELAKLVSPINYVRPGLPAIFSIAGDADPIAPYSSSVKMHAALEKAHVPHELFTVRNGGHAEFSDEECIRAWVAIRAFLTKQNLPTSVPHTWAPPGGRQGGD